MFGQRFGKICQMHRNAKRSKSGLSRNRSSTIPEDCVKFRCQLKNTRRNTLVLLKPMNLRGNAWKDLFTRIPESWKSYCRKRDEFNESLQFGPQIYFYASSNENIRCKGSSGESRGKTRENTSMAADEGQKQEWGDRWSKAWWQKIHFASLMDLCHLKNSELEPPFQKYIGRVELRCDIIKDDSGSYAVRMQYSLCRDHQHHKWRLQK